MPVVSTFYQGRAGSSGKCRDSKGAPGMTRNLAPAYVLTTCAGVAIWDVTSLQTQAETPCLRQGSGYLLCCLWWAQTAIMALSPCRHTCTCGSVPSSAFPARTLMETGETCPSLGTQPGHALCKSSWPPLKVKGTRPRTPAGNWRCRRAAGAAQLCHSFCQQ